jgi:outer membrane protein TolC
VATARRTLEMGQADMVVSVVEAHEDLLRLQRQVERDRKAVERLERFARLTAVRERQGQATHIDTLRSELRLGDARLRLSGTEQQIKTRRSEYADLLGFAPEEELAALPAPRVAVTVSNADEAVASAFSNRLDYAQILQDQEDAARGLAIAGRGLLPDLSLVSRYDRTGEGASWSEANRLGADGWFVGLALSSDFPPRLERAAYGQAEVRKESMALKVESLRFAISRQVREALQVYQRSEAEIPIAERNHEAAAKRARLARRLFEIGKGDSLSVADAEDEFRDAEANWLNAQAAASVAAYRVLRVAGTLLEYSDDLKPRAP